MCHRGILMENIIGLCGGRQVSISDGFETSLSAVGGGTNHHEGLVYSDVGHEERQEGHQHKPGRPKPLHEARHGLVQDQIAQHQFPPAPRHQRLAPSELGRLRWFQLGLLHPQVGAWMKHIKGDPESQGPNLTQVMSLGVQLQEL